MRTETINKLCCPFDKADLALTVIAQELDGNVTAGFLVCPTCNRLYPIVNGIPIMSPDEYREFDLEKPLLDHHWRKHLDGKIVDNFRLIEPETEKLP